MLDTTVPRRGFLGRAATAILALTAGPRVLGAAAPAAGGAGGPDDWLDGLTAPNRQFFDMPVVDDGLPLVHIVNYLNTYNSAYGVADADINAIGGLYGYTTLFAANDAMWAKYRIGELLDVKDKAGAHPTANPWRTSVHALGMDLPGASIEALQKRGTLFILCNNALNFFIGQVASVRGLDAAAVGADIRANLLPGVVIVPAMVIAIQKAQDKGIAYNRQ